MRELKSHLRGWYLCAYVLHSVACQRIVRQQALGEAQVSTADPVGLKAATWLEAFDETLDRVDLWSQAGNP